MILCIGGPLDGQQVDHNSSAFQVPIQESSSKFDPDGANEDYGKSFKLVEYHIENLFFGDQRYQVYFFQDDDRDLIGRLIDGYVAKREDGK